MHIRLSAKTAQNSEMFVTYRWPRLNRRKRESEYERKKERKIDRKTDTRKEGKKERKKDKQTNRQTERQRKKEMKTEWKKKRQNKRKKDQKNERKTKRKKDEIKRSNVIDKLISECTNAFTTVWVYICKNQRVYKCTYEWACTCTYKRVWKYTYKSAPTEVQISCEIDLWQFDNNLPSQGILGQDYPRHFLLIISSR